MPFKNWTPASRRIGPVRSYGSEQEGEELAPVIIPAKAPTPAAPAAPPKPEPVDRFTGRPVSEVTTLNPAAPPPGVAETDSGRAQAFVAERDKALAASKKYSEEYEQRKAEKEKEPKPPVIAPALREQEVTAPTVDVSRGTAPTPASSGAPMEDWGIPAGAIEQPKLFDFSHVGGPKPSNFVSFGELASTLDDAWRQGLESDAQAAAKAREDARRAFSKALQQANEQQVDVQSVPAYAEFLRAQSYAEDVIGGGLGSKRNAGDSVGEEALRGVYSSQMEPLAKQIREQRQAAEKFASQRNEQRVKAKASQESLPVNEPRKAPPPPRADQRGAQVRAETSEESAILDEDAQLFAADFAAANGREPTSAELAARRAEMTTNIRSGEQQAQAINRAMPGKL